MGKRDNKSFKRRMATFLAVLLALTMILSMAAPFLSALTYGSTTAVSTAPLSEDELQEVEEPTEFGGNLFSIQTQVGFDDKYRLENATPFKFIVTNNGEDFRGELQLKVYLYEGSENNTGRYAIYYIPVNLAKNATKEISMDVSIAALRKFFTVSMESDKGTVVYQQNFPTLARSPESVWTGYLSDSPSELVYLKGNKEIEGISEADAYNSSLYDSMFLTQKNFSSNVEVLKNFRAITINDFNTDSLSVSQIEALKEWVSKGGFLVLGTGVNADKVLGNLSDITEFLYTSQTRGVVTDDGIAITISDATMEDEISIMEESGISTTSYKQFGEGYIVLHKFDLGKAPVSDIANMGDVLNSVYQSISTNNFYPQYNFFNNSYQNDYYAAKSISQGIMPIKGKDITIIYYLIAIYIIILGPVLYIVLKKKDKREKGWVIIPVLSIAVTAIVYCIGLGSYYRGSIVNVVSSIDLNYGNSIANADIFVGLKSSEKGDLNFRTEDDINIDTSQMGSDYYYYGYGNVSPKEECVIRINATGKPEITYSGNESWSTNSFTASKTIDMGGTVDADLVIEGDVIKGTITNNTSYDLQSPIISYGTNFFGLDDINAGATVNVRIVNASTNTAAASGYYYSIYTALEQILDINYYYYGNNGLSILNDEEIEKYYTNYSRYRLITGHYDRSGYYSSPDASSLTSIKMFAFNNLDSMIEGEKYMNGKAMQEQQENMFTVNLPLKISSNTPFEIPFGFIKPEAIEGENGELVDYYPRDNYIYSYDVSSLVATFKIPSEINVEMFEISWTPQYGILVGAEIYNYEKEEWEIADFGYQFSGNGESEGVERYIGPNGEITIKGHFDSGDLNVPEIYLKGGAN